MAEIGVRHAEGNVVFADRLHEGVRLLEIQAERLFAEHRNARLDGFHGRIEMHMVRRDDEDVIELLVFGQGGIGRDHLVVRAVSFEGIRPVGRFLERNLRIGEQRAGGHAAGAVKVNGFLMGLTMKAPLPPPTKSDIERSV